MARNWGHSSWNQWWETQEKFDALEAKCDWLRSQLEEKCDEMKRLDGEVTRLGQESKDLMQRVSEAEDVNAVLERKLADLSVAGASAAGVSERPAEVAKRAAEASVVETENSGTLTSAAGVGEIPATVAEREAEASTGDGEKPWTHLEAKDGETATSRGGVPGKYCQGGDCD